MRLFAACRICREGARKPQTSSNKSGFGLAELIGSDGLNEKKVELNDKQMGASLRYYGYENSKRVWPV